MQLPSIPLVQVNSLLRAIPPAIAVALAAHCSNGNSNDYSPEQQTQAVSAVSGAWSTADGSACLELHEDLVTKPASGACATWLVRSGGHGGRLREGGGCGGCPAEMIGLFTATLVVGDSVTHLAGEVTFGLEDAPFARPWEVHLTGGPSTEAYASGELGNDGTMTLSPSPFLRGDAGSALQPSYSLHWKGEGSTCATK